MPVLSEVEVLNFELISLTVLSADSIKNLLTGDKLDISTINFSDAALCLFGPQMVNVCLSRKVKAMPDFMTACSLPVKDKAEFSKPLGDISISETR
jgi:hypothetical protein